VSFSLSHCVAVITGASSGLGEEFARQLAPVAKELVLVARRAALLDELATQLRSAHPQLRIHICPADLSTDGTGKVIELVEVLGLKPNLLINNAGIGDYGSFASASISRLQGQIQLNITALVQLTHGLLPSMPRPGAVLNVSSLASTLPMPDLAVYAATKAFVTSWSEALHIELEKEGITVTAVCPGPTPTNFGKNARRADGSDTNRSGQGLLRIMPEQVVRDGLAALQSGKPVVYPGIMVSLAATVFRVMPRSMMRWINCRRARG
jgi:uncharacterized protein